MWWYKIKMNAHKNKTTGRKLTEIDIYGGYIMGIWFDSQMTILDWSNEHFQPGGIVNADCQCETQKWERVNSQTINKAQLQFAITTTRNPICVGSSQSTTVYILIMAMHWFDHFMKMSSRCMGSGRISLFILFIESDIKLEMQIGQSQIETLQSLGARVCVCLIILINAWHSMVENPLNWIGLYAYNGLNTNAEWHSNGYFSPGCWTNVMQLERLARTLYTLLSCLLISFESI